MSGTPGGHFAGGGGGTTMPTTPAVTYRASHGRIQDLKLGGVQ